MAKTPDEIVAEIDRKQNEEDLDLPRRAASFAKDKYHALLQAGMGMIGNKKQESEKKPFPDDISKFGQGAAEGLKQYKEAQGMKKGGKVKSPTMKYETYTKTGKPAGMKTVKVSASKRADGCCVKGKTKGKYL
jgi:hypothetical protein